MKCQDLFSMKNDNAKNIRKKNKYLVVVCCSCDWRLRANTKRHGNFSKGVLFHQENAPAHTSVTAMATINGCDF